MGETQVGWHVLVPANRKRHQLVLSPCGHYGRWREERENGVDLALDPPPMESGLEFCLSGSQRRGIRG